MNELSNPNKFLNSNEFFQTVCSSGVQSLWRPEYGAFMIEGMPGKPYNGLLAYINMVEANMKYRRQEIKELLHKDEIVITLTSFPRLGAPNFTWPIHKPQPNDERSAGHSIYFPDEAIFPHHPRFVTLTKNIRQRHGEKVNITPTVFKDENTKIPVDGAPADKPDAVYMDATGFGACCCCLQVKLVILILSNLFFNIFLT